MGDPDLERHGLGAHVVGRQDQIVQEARADLLALAFGVDGDAEVLGAVGDDLASTIDVSELGLQCVFQKPINEMTLKKTLERKLKRPAP